MCNENAVRLSTAATGEVERAACRSPTSRPTRPYRLSVAAHFSRVSRTFEAPSITCFEGDMPSDCAQGRIERGSGLP
jgi:hypothetical protein